MIIPLGTDSRLRNTPYMNWALIALNILIFVIVQHLHPDARGHVSFDMRDIDGLISSNFELFPRDPRLYTFITYSFLHASWLHLLGNMLFLYIFGNNVNDRMGHLGYLAFYLAGGIFAGIAYVLMQQGSVPVLGASGAISAVTGSYLVLFPRSNIRIFYFWYLFGEYEIPSFWFIIFYFAKDLFLNFAADSSGVAYIAHIGGTIFGFVVCFLMLFARLLPRDQFDIVALVQRWNRRRQYRDMVSRGYNPFEYASRDRPGQPPPPPDPRQEQIMNLRGAILEAISRHDLATGSHLYRQLKQIDPQQALPRQAQLDVANQLAAEHLFPQAAEAYETLLRVYPKGEQLEQIELMLGLIYARYLSQYDRAKHYLQKAMLRLHGENELAMAREELSRIEPLVTPGRS